MRLILAIALSLVGAAAAAQTAPVPRVSTITQKAEMQHIMDSLQSSLDDAGVVARIKKCTVVLTYVEPPPGTDSGTAAGCILDDGAKRTPILMCKNETATKFSWAQSDTQTQEAAVQYIQNNCLSAQ